MLVGYLFSIRQVFYASAEFPHSSLGRGIPVARPCRLGCGRMLVGPRFRCGRQLGGGIVGIVGAVGIG